MPNDMPRWEYLARTGRHLTQKELDELGEKGWELAGFSSQPVGFANRMAAYVFKRAIL